GGGGISGGGNGGSGGGSSGSGGSGGIGGGIGGSDAPAPPAFDYRARIIASNRIARDAAARFLQERGLQVVVNEESLYCDIHAAAQQLAAALRGGPPGAYIWGGEPTVVLPPKPGLGGRNQSLALLLACEIRGRRDIAALLAGTDGGDGVTAAAGALIDGDTFTAATGARTALAKANAGAYLARIAALFKPGPTGTNVMDLAVAIKR
ncbi:MAG: MOFRL family protein, partial [Gammaproteobacteria bacterium]